MGKRKSVYLAVDVGGTNIQAAAVERSGLVAVRKKLPTPREGGPEPIVAAIEEVIRSVIEKDGRLADRGPRAIGIGVPGVVDPKKGLVVLTPNMGLTGCLIGPRLEDTFGAPVALGNDCNLGTLGERWLGSARRAASVMGILVGTGIGGGFIQKSRLWRGAREAACEIGHIVMEIGGPLCGCGNRGCLEALASRTAIERQLREAVAAGRPTVLVELLGGDLGVVRSNVLRQALQLGDALVGEVLGRAAEVLGHACLTVRHLLDPEIIVLGGGVMEACGGFIMPIVERIVLEDRLPGARQGGEVLLSALGDDAVVLGAAALAQMHVGEDPLRAHRLTPPYYPEITTTGSGTLRVGDRAYARGLYVTADARVKPLDDLLADQAGQPRLLPSHLEKPCRGGPEVLFVGTPDGATLELTDAAAAYLRQRAIDVQVLPTRDAVAAFNDSQVRRAAILFVS